MTRNQKHKTEVNEGGARLAILMIALTLLAAVVLAAEGVWLGALIFLAALILLLVISYIIGRFGMKQDKRFKKLTAVQRTFAAFDLLLQMVANIGMIR